MGCKILTWDEFREFCRMDAFFWYNSGYDANEVTEEDILNEYPEDYFDDEEQETDDLSSCFTPHEFAEKKLQYLTEMEEEEKE